jgi:hypothetical protein
MLLQLPLVDPVLFAAAWLVVLCADFAMTQERHVRDPFGDWIRNIELTLQ